MDVRNVPRQGGGMPPNRRVPPPPPSVYQPGGYSGGPQLFEDTSYAGQQQQGYGAPPGPGGGWQGYSSAPAFQTDQFLKDPMAAMAMQYGSQLAGHGQKMVNEKLERYVSVSKLKYYFAVDTAYVCKKLALLLFPFSHTDWAVKYDQNEPVPPRYDVNAPDLYIPSMAFVTYILLSGYMLGLNDKFTPEQLGMQASTALMWLTLEVLVVLLATYVLSINSSLRLFDIIAFSSYKFVSMISAMLASLLLQSFGYWIALGYTSLSLDFFLLRTLRIAVLSNPSSDQYGHNSRKGLYLLLGICLLQPIMCYFMTYRLVRTTVSAE